MNYVKVAKTDELQAGEKRKVSIEDKQILLTNIQDSYYAIDNTCPHMGGSLFDGKLEGSHIVCPRHGSVFDVTTGKAVEGGKLIFKIKVHDVSNYPVKIDGNDVLIGIE